MLASTNSECFAKSYHSDAFLAELVKARLLYEKSLESGFTAPAVLDFDEATATIRYERLQWSGCLMDVLADRNRSHDSLLGLLNEVGACLAAIHAIGLPEGAVYSTRSPLFSDALLTRSTSSQGGGAGVLQHGDFGFTNIFITDDDQIVVIDPSPNQYISVHPLNVDVPELDLAVLMSHLIGRSVRPRALGRSIIFGRQMVDAVLAGYESGAGVIDRDRLRSFTLAGVDAVRAYKSTGSRAHRRAILKPLAAVLARNIA